MSEGLFRKFFSSSPFFFEKRISGSALFEAQFDSFSLDHFSNDFFLLLSISKHLFFDFFNFFMNFLFLFEKKLAG